MTQIQDERRVEREAEPRPPSVEERAPGERRAFVIRPAPRWPHLDFGELWHYREVLWTIVWRESAGRIRALSSRHLRRSNVLCAV